MRQNRHQDLAILRLPQVEQRTGLSRSTLNAVPLPPTASTALQVSVPPLANTARYDSLRADLTEEVDHDA